MLTFTPILILTMTPTLVLTKLRMPRTLSETLNLTSASAWS
jgi:hypothetical protein